ncbi:MAG: hypothetical protein CM15mP32_5980 [Flavobacteriaceae bacterium]|nr:MAG: hypothetical protein CM15mP32_5980 [Flavobacteriaceae bacterium]
MGSGWIFMDPRCIYQYQYGTVLGHWSPISFQIINVLWFVTQTLIIGIGTWAASNLPWIVSQLGVSDDAAPYIVPMSVR